MDWTDPIPMFLAFALTLMFFTKIASLWSSRIREDFPPGPRSLPIIGNLHIIDLKRPYRTLLELSKSYGPVFSIQMGFTKMVVLSGYETVKEALVDQADAFAGRPNIPVLEDLFKGNGIIFARGENWKVMRRFTLSTLRDFGMGKAVIEDRVVEECRYLIENIESQKGKPFDPTIIMNAAVANIIVSILLGKRFGYEDPQFIRLLNLINENVRVGGYPSVAVYNTFPALGFLLKGHKTLLRNRDEMHAFIQVTFIEHLKNLDKNDQRSLIDAFLIKQQEEKNDNDGYFHNENLKTLVTNLFAAGMETTSTTLRWGFLLMMKYPKIQSKSLGTIAIMTNTPHLELWNSKVNLRAATEKVQDEIARVLGSNPPRTEHRTQLPYTDAVVHEIQRFANILPLNLPHETTVDVTLKGCFIPKGTFIIPLLTSVLRDQSQWEKPDVFYPEHFLDSEGKFVKKEAFMPFSAGRRMCVGENLAKMELFLFFTSLVQRFTLHPAPGVSSSDLDLTPAIGFAILPMPHQICAVPRA